MSGTPEYRPRHMKVAEAPSKSETSTQEQVGRSAALMSVLVVVSRLTGFMRTWGQAYAIGVTVMASCYSIANNLPNQLYELVAAGMLTTAFLPVYMTVKKRAGTEGASAYTSNLVSIVLVAMGAVAVLGFVFAAQMVYTQSFSATEAFDFDLTVYFFRFFVIEVVLYALSSIFSGVLNAERDYFWGQAAPIFNNFVTTASFLVYAALADKSPEIALLVLALGNPLGVAVQVILQIPPMLRHGIRLRFRIDLHDPLLKETLRIGVPSLAVVVASFVTTSVQSSSALSVVATGASITYYVADTTIDLVFFGVALYALLSGLILIVMRRRIFSHMVGFLVIENGVFLFSTAIGVEMPLLINFAILLDILISVLMLGIFFTKIDGKIHADDADALTNVKD